MTDTTLQARSLAFADRVDELADRVRPPSAAAAELHMAAIQFRAEVRSLTPEVSDEMVERVARAIWAEMGPSNFGWTFEQDREDMESLARAALEAMR